MKLQYMIYQLCSRRMIFVVLCCFFIFPLVSCWQTGTGSKSEKTTSFRQHTISKKEGRKINRHARLVYTRHARCRMGCRHITAEEVKEIVADGKINEHKSDPGDRPCPTYALEGYTREEHQHVRIVVANCADELKVVTCIDLERDWSCHCN